MLKEDFEKVLNDYLDAKKENNTTSAPIANFIRNDFVEDIKKSVDISKFRFTGSAGRGNLAAIPWISMPYGDQSDFDVAYLFKSDMSGFYIVLRAYFYQKTIDLHSYDLINYLKNKSSNVRDFLINSNIKTDDLEISIDLVNTGNTAQSHMAGIIFAKYYNKKNIPSDEILIKDLNRFFDLCEFTVKNYKNNKRDDDANNEVNSEKNNEDLSFFKYIFDKGYYFDKEIIENYLLSLKVKPFLILTGNSGTGKTKLSQLFAQYLNKEDNNLNNYRIIPVGANWTENRNIVGYYNLITDEYQSTPAFELIKESESNSTEPYFLILDEMNLSHVERYFADFLSAIESGEPIPLYGTKEELNIPNNLFIVGTVNVDETTYMFSPKVLDRANVIEFDIGNLREYMSGKSQEQIPSGNLEYLQNPINDLEVQELGIEDLKEKFEGVIFNGNDFWKILSSEINKFQKILKLSHFDFGFRVINEITRFMFVAWKYEGQPTEWNNWQRYFDAQIKQKILPKLHGSEKMIEKTINNLINACLTSYEGDNPQTVKYKTSYDKLNEMKDTLEKQRFVSFIN